MKFGRPIFGAGVALVVAACGASQPANAPPQERAYATSPSQSPRNPGDMPSAPQPGQATVLPSGTATMPVAPLVPGAPVAPGSPSSLATLVNELVDLQKGIDLAMSAGMRQCDLACRALASMQKAVEKLCRLAQGEAEQRQCEDARTKLRAAETHVKNECGECAR